MEPTTQQVHAQDRDGTDERSQIPISVLIYGEHRFLNFGIDPTV